jgi:hypothetical protein
VSAPEPEAKAVVREFSELFRSITARHLARFEGVIGLANPNPEFREKVMSAVSICAFQHRLEPHSIRRSHIRKTLLEAGEAARKADENLCQLDAALNALPEPVLKTLEGGWGPTGEIARRFIDNERSWLRRSAACMDFFAKAFADKGGRPKLRAFHVLAVGLASAFGAGTGRRATVNWNGAKDQWGGKFMELVEAVLPLAKELAGTERPLQTPASRLALGQYLHDLTRLKVRNRNRPRSR